MGRDPRVKDTRAGIGAPMARVGACSPPLILGSLEHPLSSDSRTNEGWSPLSPDVRPTEITFPATPREG
jgi:hypothetical protein